MLIKYRVFLTMFLLLSGYSFFGIPQIQAEQAGQVEEPNPANIYIERNAHPFEGCRYQEWTVKKNTVIHKEADFKSELIATVYRGDSVKALTGILYIHPVRFLVTKDYFRPDLGMKPFYKGDICYLLAPIGEGFFKVWHNGKIETFTPFGLKGFASKADNGNEWGILQGEYANEWWVQMTLQNGITGWARVEDGSFGNMCSF